MSVEKTEKRTGNTKSTDTEKTDKNNLDTILKYLGIGWSMAVFIAGAAFFFGGEWNNWKMVKERVVDNEWPPTIPIPLSQNVGFMYDFNSIQISQGEAEATIEVEHPSVIMVTSYVSADADPRAPKKLKWLITDTRVGGNLCTRSGSNANQTPDGLDFEVVDTCVMRLSPGKVKIEFIANINNTTTPTGTLSYALFRDPQVR